MSSMNVPSQYNFILERAKSMPRPLRVAIAGSDTENILRGAIAAHEDGFVDPILIGNYKKTKKILSDLGYSDENFDFQPITNDTNPVQYQGSAAPRAEQDEPPDRGRSPSDPRRHFYSAG